MNVVLIILVGLVFVAWLASTIQIMSDRKKSSGTKGNGVKTPAPDPEPIKDNPKK
tara:strand:- start:984 stop:1148 length:165 start_codon:yes stop_codon:yes gene_type:complete